MLLLTLKDLLQCSQVHLKGVSPVCIKSVSYTHLDVYKRQPMYRQFNLLNPERHIKNTLKHQRVVVTYIAR